MFLLAINSLLCMRSGPTAFVGSRFLITLLTSVSEIMSSWSSQSNGTISGILYLLCLNEVSLNIFLQLCILIFVKRLVLWKALYKSPIIIIIIIIIISLSVAVSVPLSPYLWMSVSVCRSPPPSPSPPPPSLSPPHPHPPPPSTPTCWDRTEYCTTCEAATGTAPAGGGLRMWGASL